MAVAQLHLPHLARHHDEAVAAEPRPVPTLGHTVGVWVVIMIVGFVVGLTLIIWAVTGSFLIGLGVGGFCALWGGPGFGIMAGSAAHAMAEERAERLAARRAHQA
jgi:hypothetical protein